jgi:hypothetical protein
VRYDLIAVTIYWYVTQSNLVDVYWRFGGTAYADNTALNWIFFIMLMYMIFIVVWLNELHKLYSSPSIIRVIKSRRMRWAGHVARIREKRNAYMIFVGNPDWKRTLGRPRRGWVNSIRMDLWDGVDWIDMAQDRDQWRALVKTVLNFRVSWSAMKFLRGCTIGGSSRRAQFRE